MTDMKTLVTSLYDLLQPADTDDRRKAIKAALTMLGDSANAGSDAHADSDADENSDSAGFHIKAKSWMKKYTVTAEQLSHIFHMENDTVEIIAHEVPGASTKQKTINAYVLTGIGQLLVTGEAKFDDKAGRAACQSLGCLNDSNHATYMKDKGNVLSGSKDSGWTLTGPGLKVGADLVKGLASE